MTFFGSGPLCRYIGHIPSKTAVHTDLVDASCALFQKRLVFFTRFLCMFISSIYLFLF